MNHYTFRGALRTSDVARPIFAVQIPKPTILIKAYIAGYQTVDTKNFEIK